MTEHKLAKRKQPRKRPLTDKQTLFVKEYLKDFNATQAARRAKYKGNNLDKIGSELLGKTRVQEAIRKGRDKIMQKADITVEEIVAELKIIGKANFYEILNKIGRKEPLTEDEQRVISERTITQGAGRITKDGRVVPSGSVKYRAYDKVRSLELLGKYKAMFTDKFDHSGEVNVTFTNKSKK